MDLGHFIGLGCKMISFSTDLFDEGEGERGFQMTEGDIHDKQSHAQ